MRRLIDYIMWRWNCAPGELSADQVQRLVWGSRRHKNRPTH